MAIEYDGDVIIVTGGAGGLGSAHCRLLAALGARVVVNDTGGVVDGRGGDPEAAARVVGQIEADGGTAVADSSDGSTRHGAAALIEHALDEFGRIDGIVANAGILRDKSFAKMEDEDFVAVLEAHLMGTVRVFHAAYPHLEGQQYGRLVATTSAAGLFGNFGQTNYSAAKMAMVGLTRSLALEGARRGIHANLIAPIARTRMTEALMPSEMAELLAPEKVSPLVALLCHRSCALNGEIFSAGGGRFARVRVGVGHGVVLPEATVDSLDAALDDLLEDTELEFPADAGGEAAVMAGTLAAAKK